MANRFFRKIPEYLSYLLMIVCFPLNPLVFLKIIEPYQIRYLPLFGWGVWLIGMIFVIYPFIYLKRKGNVKRGRAYVHTEKLVATGLYSIVRHVQYTGGILSIFIATPLLYPHWLFFALCAPGIMLIYLSALNEEKYLIKKFGDEYSRYAEKVPAVNILSGLFRKIK